MMVSQILGASSGLVAGILGVAILFPTPSFIEINEFSITGRMVKTTRTISGPDVFADWKVTIVADGTGSPVCQTVTGANMHEGWSHYSQQEDKKKEFDLDVWVGDEGCFDRMQSGGYTEYVTWTPRDGRDPVVHTYEFVKK